MAIRLKKKGKPIKPELLEMLEKSVNNHLPNDFKKFLMENDGGEPEPNEFDIPVIKTSSGVTYFLGANEILMKKNSMKERFILEAWPIAQTEGGNYVCLVTGERTGIYYWEHENEAEEGEPATLNNMSIIVSTFTEFLDALKEFDITKIKLKPGQVKKIWIDPDFKPKF